MTQVLILLSAIVALCSAQDTNTGFGEIIIRICPEGVTGPVADLANCARFYECFNGTATSMECHGGLEFNPETKRCDWVHKLKSPACTRVSKGSERNVFCVGTKPVQHVQDPGSCNAFMTCSNGVLLDGCTFCPGSQYFDATSMRCVDQPGKAELENQCNNKKMIPINQQRLHRLGASCHPTNPALYEKLLRKIEFALD